MGPAMESLGTETGRRKASLRPCSQRFHRWSPRAFFKDKKNRQNDFACFFIIYKLKSSINCKLSTISYHLVPLYSVRITAALVVFQRICQGGCVTTEGEVVARIWSENHRTAHVKTV